MNAYQEFVETWEKNIKEQGSEYEKKQVFKPLVFFIMYAIMYINGGSYECNERNKSTCKSF